MDASTFIADYIKTRVATSRIGSIQDATIYLRIKQEQQAVLFAYNWRFLKTSAELTVASGEADFPENYGRIIGIQNLADEAFLTLSDMDDYIDEDSSANVFALDDVQGKILIKADGAYRIYYQLTAPREVSAKTEILLGLEGAQYELLYDALADGVLARIYAFYQKYEESGYWKAQKTLKLKKLFAITRKSA